jgi:hypothetical protein
MSSDRGCAYSDGRIVQQHLTGTRGVLAQEFVEECEGVTSLRLRRARLLPGARCRPDLEALCSFAAWDR